MTAAVRLEGVSKRFRLVHERNSSLKALVMRGMRRTVYDEFWALEDVSFEVAHGETFALIGHNGSGKSTALKCIAGIYRPDAGSIHLDGSMSALLELGAGFHPELSGRENVYLNASILGLSKRDIDTRFDDIVAFAGLERFIDAPVKNYSSGMFVRLGFSVAINVEPDILLVDEVLAVGDEEFQRRCLSKIRQLRADGRTVVVVTHSLDTVQSLCDHALWLDHGQVQALGPAKEVADAYLASVTEAQLPKRHRIIETAAELTRASADQGARLDLRVRLGALPADSTMRVELFQAGDEDRVVAGAEHEIASTEPSTMVCVVDGLPVPAGGYLVVVSLVDPRGGVYEWDVDRVHLLETDSLRRSRGVVRVPFTFAQEAEVNSAS